LNKSLSESEHDLSQQQLRSHTSVKSQEHVNKDGFRSSTLDGAMAKMKDDDEILRIIKKIRTSIF